MAVTLLKISGGSTSLEFDEDDWGVVKDEVIRRFGEITVEEQVLDYSIAFGGERFRCSVLADEPHLMAETARGATMLEEIATAFGKGGEWIATQPLPHTPTSHAQGKVLQRPTESTVGSGH
jgi:hypothetical protein